MDLRTIEAYQRDALDFSSKYEQAKRGLSSLFPVIFRRGQIVLDVGAGSGRDMAALRKFGIDAWGIEPSGNMRACALRLHPELKTRLCDGALPDNTAAIKEVEFDGILVSSTIMHIPEAELLDSAIAVRSLLRPNGKLVISFNDTRPEIDPGNNRDDLGRLYILRDETELNLFFQRIGFEVESRWESADALERDDFGWTTLVLRHRGDLSRPIDRIASIISRDSKTTSYKLALLRALCDIAILYEKRVSHDPNRQVRIPLRDISRLWILYYWPICEDGRKLIQTRTPSKPIRFRSKLTELVDAYRDLNGLSAFLYEESGNLLPADIVRLYEATIRLIEAAIVKGPVVFSGNARGETEFSYDAAHNSIVMASELWAEFVLMGHWVHDSILLHWAELTQDFNADLNTGEALELLLATGNANRTDARVKELYNSLAVKECVWTGMPLDSGLNVDHVIPFSIRHDSALWNLMPSDPKTNADKKARLPTISVLDRSKQRFVYNWQILEEWDPIRFDRDYERFVGTRVNSEEWPDRLWRMLRETVEFTAVSRGVERWEPRRAV